MNRAVLRALCVVPLVATAMPGCGGADEGQTGADAPMSTSSATDVDASSSSTGEEESSTSSTTEPPTTEPPTTGMTTVPIPECGDGVPEPPEECDDGNQMAGDGCENDCTMSVDTSEWVDIVGGGASVQESGTGVTIDGEGNAFVIGYIVDDIGDTNIWLRKYTPGGEETFTVTFDPSMGADDRGHGVALDSGGNILVTGEVELAPAESDIWIAKLDPDGTELWNVVVPGPEFGSDLGKAIAVDSADNAVVGGYIRVGNGDNDAWIGKYDPMGAELWVHTVAGDDGLDDRIEGIAVADDDTIIATGFLSNEGFNRDVWLGKLDADGNEVWTTIYDSVKMGSESGFGLAIAPDGSIGVAGTSPLVANNDEVWLAKFEAEAGEIVWQKKFGGPAVLNDAALGVAADSESAFVVVGFKSIDATDSDIWLRKWDTGGNVVWTQNVAGAGADRDQALAVAIDGDDNFVVAGEIREEASNNGDIWVGKFGP